MLKYDVYYEHMKIWNMFYNIVCLSLSTIESQMFSKNSFICFEIYVPNYEFGISSLVIN